MNISLILIVLLSGARCARCYSRMIKNYIPQFEYSGFFETIDFFFWWSACETNQKLMKILDFNFTYWYIYKSLIRLCYLESKTTRDLTYNVIYATLRRLFLALPKTLVKFSHWSDLIFTVFARPGATGTWTPEFSGAWELRYQILEWYWENWRNK